MVFTTTFTFDWPTLKITTMEKMIILTDSGSDLTDAQAQQYGVAVVRNPMVVGGENFIENNTITDEEVMRRMRDGQTVTTSQPTLGSVIETVDALLKTYDKVIYVPISSGLSGTYASACSLIAQYDGRLVVVDSKAVAYLLGYQVKKAAEMIKLGYSAEQIKAALESHYYFAILIPENLTALKRGGRVKPAVAALGNLLKIIPLLQVKDGVIDVYDKVRTLKKAYEHGIEAVVDVEDRDEYEFAVLHTIDMADAARQKAMELEAIVGSKVYVGPLRSIIAAHTGPGTLAWGRIRKIHVEQQ